MAISDQQSSQPVRLDAPDKPSSLVGRMDPMREPVPQHTVGGAGARKGSLADRAPVRRTDAVERPSSPYPESRRPREPGSGAGSATAPAPSVFAPVREPDLMTAPWPLRDTLELGAQPGAVPSARLHARAIVYEWARRHRRHVELLVAELVSNAVQASASVTGPAYPPVFLRLSSDWQCLLIEVWDASSDPPVVAAVDLMAESGRGLQLVEALSAKWSWYFPETGGKVVWSEVRPE